MSIPSRPAALLAAIALVALVLAGCASSPLVSSSPGPGLPVAAATPVLTPVPGGVMPPFEVPGAGLVPSEGEAMLLGGIRTDLQAACGPVREDLPQGAVASAGCVPAKDEAAYVRFDMFDDQTTMIDSYTELLQAAGVEPMANQGSCFEVELAEGPWIPTQDPAAPAERNACWMDADGLPIYMVTQPPYVLVTVTGTRGTGLGIVQQYAWLGNEDVPGAPTLWREVAVDAEK